MKIIRSTGKNLIKNLSYHLACLGLLSGCSAPLLKQDFRSFGFPIMLNDRAFVEKQTGRQPALIKEFAAKEEMSGAGTTQDTPMGNGAVMRTTTIQRAESDQMAIETAISSGISTCGEPVVGNLIIEFSLTGFFTGVFASAEAKGEIYDLGQKK